MLSWWGSCSMVILFHHVLMYLFQNRYGRDVLYSQEDAPSRHPALIERKACIKTQKPLSGYNRERGFWQIMKSFRRISEHFSFRPCFLVQPADSRHDGEKEQSEHEIGCRSQPLIKQMADVEKQERGDNNDKSPCREHHDGAKLMHMLQVVLMDGVCCYNPFLLPL